MQFKSAKLLVIGHNWPEPLATAAGKRMMQLLDFFASMEVTITFASTAIKTDYSADLSDLGIQQESIQLNHPSFDEFVRLLKPDIVVLDRFMTEEQFGWRVSENAPEALRILNTEDLHSLRSVRAKKADCKATVDFTNWIDADITKRELASIYRSDLSLIISAYEMDVLRERAKIAGDLLQYLPFLPAGDPKLNHIDHQQFSERVDFVFVGNGKHQPNIDAIKWLESQIWPLIRQSLPEVNLHIYGAYLPEEIRDLHDESSGFLVHGWTKDSRTVVAKARVNLAPLRFGAGMKGKLIEAMALGTPSISTTLGWEGIADINLEFNGRADNAEDFANKAVELYQNRSVWNGEQNFQLRRYQEVIERSDHLDKLKQRIIEIKEDLSGHRNKNIVGALLTHQTMAGTKYMSKWIEAKNRAGNSN